MENSQALNDRTTPPEEEDGDLLLATGSAEEFPDPSDVPAEDLQPTERVNLRIPLRAHLAARQSAAPLDADSVQVICQGLLEEALRQRAGEAHRRALASLQRQIGGLLEPLSDVPTIKTKDIKPISVYLSPYALRIAQDLGLRKGVSLSVQKVCEPLLTLALKQHRAQAVRTARAIIAQLEAPDDEQDRPPS